MSDGLWANKKQLLSTQKIAQLPKQERQWRFYPMGMFFSHILFHLMSSCNRKDILPHKYFLVVLTLKYISNIAWNFGHRIVHTQFHIQYTHYYSPGETILFKRIDKELTARFTRKINRFSFITEGETIEDTKNLPDDSIPVTIVIASRFNFNSQ